MDDASTAALAFFIPDVELRPLLFELVGALARAIESRNAYTVGHLEDVVHYGLALGRELGLSPSDLEKLHLAALLHDVGELGVPEGILNKPGELTKEEYALVKQHPRIAARLLEEVESLEEVIPIIYHHHERYDGSGYPDGLAGDAIPFESRILAVTEAFDALTCPRPYRPAKSVDEALRILTEGAGEHWDPLIVRTWVRMVHQRRDELVG